MSILSDTATDARVAARTLSKAWVSTTVTVITVALGISATTVVFSVVNAVLLQPLPYAEPDRLVKIVENVPAEETRSGVAVRRSTMSQDDFETWREGSRTLSHLAMLMNENATLSTDQGTVLLAGQRVSPALFAMRGVAPVLGRGLLPNEERPDADVVVISEATWRRYLAGDADVIGRLVTLDGQPREVVGVMPAEFGPEAFWLPLYIPPPQTGRTVFADVTARLRDGVSLEESRAEANVLGAQMRMTQQEPGARPRFELVPELDQAVAPVLPALRVLVVAVGAVLLIVCTNVANLLLARGVRRQHEIAIRSSLGASRARIVRQVLTESLVLAGMAGLVGIALAYGGVELLKALAGAALTAGTSVSPPILPRIEDVAIDPLALAFVACLSIATGLVFGALPALRLSRSGGAQLSLAGGHADRPTSTRAGNTLATAQIALATALLVPAGLLLVSFLKLASVDVGFDPRNVLSFDLVVPGDYSAERRLEVAEAVALRVADDSRVASAGYTDAQPLQPFVFFYSQFVPEGYTAEEIREEQADLGSQRTQNRFVSGGYLRALGARLVSGTWLDDERSTQPGLGVLVTRPFAERYFRGTDAVGSTIQSRWGELSIVGVVDGIHMLGPDSAPEPIVFLDARDVVPELPPLRRQFLTLGTGAISFAARTMTDPLSIVSSVRSIIDDIDPALGMDNVVPLDELHSATSSRPRFFAVFVSAFAGIAAFIALIGVYGVLTYVVGQRTKEIGVRIALGAQRSQVRSLILRHGFFMVLIGVGAGLAGAAWLTRYLETMLFDITQLDAETYAVVAAAFAAVALLAAYLPARRAMRVDPIAALRYE